MFVGGPRGESQESTVRTALPTGGFGIELNSNAVGRTLTTSLYRNRPGSDKTRTLTAVRTLTLFVFVPNN